MKVFSIYSIQGHNDCLILISADNEEDALQKAIDFTDIADNNFCETNLRADELNGLSADGEYFHIFADDISYK